MRYTRALLSALLLAAALLLLGAANSENAPSKGALPATPTGEPLTLSAQQQYELNLFLSNFSEQRFCESGLFESFDAGEAGDAQLIHFAHIWAKINRRSAIAYEGSFETISLAEVNAILDRYLELGRSLDPAEGTEYSAALGMGRCTWDRVWYEYGRIYFPAADGESYNRFTVAHTAARLPDGRLSVRFTVYELDLLRYQNGGVTGAYYRLTPEEAAKLAAAGEIEALRRGTALCTPWQLQDSGRESYRLTDYRLEE